MATKAVLPSGVIASGPRPGWMSLVLVLVFTSIVDPGVPTTKAVLPSGVIATPNGLAPTGMSTGFFVLVFTSIVATALAPCGDPTAKLPRATKAVLPSGVITTFLG